MNDNCWTHRTLSTWILCAGTNWNVQPYTNLEFIHQIVTSNINFEIYFPFHRLGLPILALDESGSEIHFEFSEHSMYQFTTLSKLPPFGSSKKSWNSLSNESLTNGPFFWNLTFCFRSFPGLRMISS